MFKFLGRKIRELFKGKVSEESIDQLEELFYKADLGSQISSELTEKARVLWRKKPSLSSDELLTEIKQELLIKLGSQPPPAAASEKPHVILIVGVNGNGKTTSIAKLAHSFQKQGKKVLIAAADTFRAAATEQLEKWAEGMGASLVKGKMGSDPAAVVFDALLAAQARGVDIVLIDTAGRLHTKTDLMKELEKIKRVCSKAYPGSPHETLLVLDSTIGQNGIEQAANFHRYTPLTGLILTKLDGSAKGGSVIAIQRQLQIPVKYIGTGETIKDIEIFDPPSFISALFE